MLEKAKSMLADSLSMAQQQWQDINMAAVTLLLLNQIPNKPLNFPNITKY